MGDPDLENGRGPAGHRANRRRRRPRWCSSHGPHAVGPPPSISAPQSPSTSTATTPDTTCPSTSTPSRHGPRPPGGNRDSPPVLQLAPDRGETATRRCQRATDRSSTATTAASPRDCGRPCGLSNADTASDEGAAQRRVRACHDRLDPINNPFNQQIRRSEHLKGPPMLCGAGRARLNRRRAVDGRPPTNEPTALALPAS